MANEQSNWIDFLISLTPVVQTGIWAGVAIGALATLRTPLKRLAEELVRRVNQGDKVSTPWLSIEKREARERQVVEKVAENIRKEWHTSSEESSARNSELSDDEIETLLEKARHEFVDLIFPASDFQIKTGQDAKTSLYVTDWQTVSEFLNETYLAATEIGVEIPIWTYDSFWRYRNNRTGELIVKSKGHRMDMRPFESLDVLAGDILTAERVR
ncbi:MAG: hypothetical protein ABJM29_01885 [Rhizobiaceae bacterium]